VPLPRLVVLLSPLALLGIAAPSAQPIAPDAIVERIGDYVERYYGRAQHIVADETVTLQPLNASFGIDGFARRLTYELRVDWDPAAADRDSPALVTRQLLSINSRAPRPNAEPECLDPPAASPEPLAFLLAARRDAFAFRSARFDRVGARPAIVVEYRARNVEPPVGTWRDDNECASFDLPGRSQGRIWADPGTGEVLRMDESITGMVDVRVPIKQQRTGLWPMYVTIERADTTIEYKAVTFTDPDEQLMLPMSIDTLTVIRSGGISRRRMMQTFSNYRRFVTASRIVE
jgi:hypothetical protein